MSLDTMRKISRTRYYLDGKWVNPKTPGAEKAVEESKQWYAYRRDGQRQVKVRLYTDKASSSPLVSRALTVRPSEP